VALGADDPLLFGKRLTAQYEIARQVHGLADDQIAELARMSVRGSAAPAATAARLLAGIDDWLATPAQPSPAQPPPPAPPPPAPPAFHDHEGFGAVCDANPS
jgi:adenosine deaminase